MKTKSLFTFFSIAAVLLSSGQAATVTWSSGIIRDASDVITTGTLVSAYNFGNPDLKTPSGQTPGSPVVNGVTFKALSVPSRVTSASDGNFTISIRSVDAATRFVNTGGNQLPAGSMGLTGDYEKLLSGGYTVSYGDAETGTNSYDMTFGNLTAGHTYLVQFWVNTSTDDPYDRTFSNTGDPSDTGITVSSNNGSKNNGLGNWVTAQFVADETQTITLAMSGTYYPKINAVQLRDLGAIPESSTTALALLAGAGLFFRRKR